MPIFKAIGTKVVNWFAILEHRAKSHHPSIRRKGVKLIPVFLLFPIAAFCNLCLQISNTSQNRRIVRLGIKQLLLHLENHPIQLNSLGRYRRICLQREQTLRDLGRSLQCAEGTGNHVHHVHLPQMNEWPKHIKYTRS